MKTRLLQPGAQCRVILRIQHPTSIQTSSRPLSFTLHSPRDLFTQVQWLKHVTDNTMKPPLLLVLIYPGGPSRASQLTPRIVRLSSPAGAIHTLIHFAFSAAENRLKVSTVLNRFLPLQPSRLHLFKLSNLNYNSNYVCGFD